MNRIILKKGKSRPVKRYHPWVFSGAIQDCGDVEDGEIAEVFDFKGEFLGKGYFNSKSQIAVRILEWDREVEISREWWRNRITNAVKLREHLKETDSLRMVYSEADFLPGLIVDKYSEYLAVQILTRGIEKQRGMITELLLEYFNPKGIFEKVDEVTKEKEGLTGVSGTVYGNVPEEIIINESGNKFYVNVKSSQKTGFYLDQRENRKLLNLYVNRKKILDCFSFTGGFSVYAAKAGAENLTLLDSSEEVLKIASKNFKLNEIPENNINLIQADVFKEMRKFRDKNEKFDVIILDPPKLAPSKYQKEKALRAYKDINLLGLKLLNP
ncbi:MAG TPA: class I SAM-dependent rRNA methyltransferase, partial [Firmicutes bacterium]|nr:class I SAM-dependent rRNA methyltransferase [Bacillota bacterium]